MSSTSAFTGSRRQTTQAWWIRLWRRNRWFSSEGFLLYPERREGSLHSAANVRDQTQHLPLVIPERSRRGCDDVVEGSMHFRDVNSVAVMHMSDGRPRLRDKSLE